MSTTKLAGPKDAIKVGWKLIRKGLHMEEPTPVGSFLGCNHIRTEVTLPNGKKGVMMKYEMRNFMKSCVDKYMELAPGARLRPVDTPFLPEDQMLSPASKPACDVKEAGGVIECEWCRHTMPQIARYTNRTRKWSRRVRRDESFNQKKMQKGKRTMRKTEGDWPLLRRAL